MAMIQEQKHGKHEPLELCLTRQLGLPGSTYLPQYFFGEDYYCEPGTVEGRRRELAALALAAAQEGELTGKLGLDYIASNIFLGAVSKYKEEVVYHGSPGKLTAIEPRQAYSHPTDRNKPYHFADGQPAICASPTTKFPVLRALLHDSRPEISSQPLVLRKTMDRHGRVSWVTSEETLAVLESEGARGVVCPIELNNTQGRDAHPSTYDRARDEYRIYGSQIPLVDIAVGADDLPPDLCVIPTDSHLQLESAGRYGNIVEWSERRQVPLRPLGGLFPKEYIS